MNKIVNLSLVIILLIFGGCNANGPAKNETKERVIEDDMKLRGDKPDSETKFPEVRNLQDYKLSTFIPTIESTLSDERNVIYCVTMLYAWNAVRGVLNAPVQLTNASEAFNKLNASRSYIAALDSPDYKIKVEVDGDMIRTEASFNKSLPFDHVLSTFSHEQNLVFNKTRVVSFGVKGNDHEAAYALRILYYKDDNDFIISLTFRDTLHEIILSKSKNHFNTMAKILADINSKMELGEQERKPGKKSWRYVLNEPDEVVIPKFKFNIESNYRTIEGQTFAAGNSIYEITKAWQQNAFVLDEGGAGIGSDAATWIELAMMPGEPEKPKPKLMRFDKPFFLMLKKTGSKYPYFAMWTNNTELMVLD